MRIVIREKFRDINIFLINLIDNGKVIWIKMMIISNEGQLDFKMIMLLEQ